MIDVGAGASALVDFLRDAGFTRLAVLDISAAALQHARQRLGVRAAGVEWFFHFLTDPADRGKYVATMSRALTPDSHVIIAIFAIEGPLKCSGLDVAR